MRSPLIPLTAAFALALGAMAARAEDLTVSAAASLTNAFRELAPLFESAHPGTRVLLNFAASDALVAQIARGAPVDVFAAADQESMDRAESQTLLAPGTRRDFVGNALVVAVPMGAASEPKGLADLLGPAPTRVALGAPASVPAGRYAKGALVAAGLWGAIEPRVIYGQSVRQVLDYVARGEVDAGFVYLTDAAIMKDKVKVAFTVSTATPISYPIAIIGSSSQRAMGASFVDFLASAQARSVLARYGFRTP
jgi:molybdate transport system substrate-binding protein